MRKSRVSNKIFKFFSGVVMAAVVAAISVPVYAMEDGAYTVGRTTSYANPDTGLTMDGGTNIALGDSMCASIVDTLALVEQYQGSTYVTLGIGLMSNVTNVRFQIQGENGSYREVSATKTGSCTRNGDTCNQYRIKVDVAENRISPILYVTPMGRDVQFFVTLDMNSATPGTGAYVSEMIPSAQPEAPQASTPAVSNGNGSVAPTPSTGGTSPNAQSSGKDSIIANSNTTDSVSPAADSSENTVGNDTQESTENQKNEDQVKKVQGTELLEENTENGESISGAKRGKSHTGLIVVIVIVLLLAAGGTGYWYYRKKRMSE